MSAKMSRRSGKAKTLESAIKWKMARPLPDSVEVYARLRGNLQFQCPKCGNLNSTSPEVWRRARTACRRCFASYRIGIGFCDIDGSARAMYMGRFPGHLANKLNPTGGESLVGRLHGVFDYQCPKCQKPRTVTLDWDRPTITCCQKTWSIQLLIYNTVPGPAITCPLDWIPLIDPQNPEPTYEKMEKAYLSTLKGTNPPLVAVMAGRAVLAHRPDLKNKIDPSRIYSVTREGKITDITDETETVQPLPDSQVHSISGGTS